MRSFFLPALIASLLIPCGIVCSFAVAAEDTKKTAASSNEITYEANDTFSYTLIDTPTVKDEMDTNYSTKSAGPGMLREFNVGYIVKVTIGNRHITSTNIIAFERTVFQKGEFKVTLPVYLAFGPQSSRSIKGSIFGIGFVFYVYVNIL